MRVPLRRTTRCLPVRDRNGRGRRLGPREAVGRQLESIDRDHRCGARALDAPPEARHTGQLSALQRRAGIRGRGGARELMGQSQGEHRQWS